MPFCTTLCTGSFPSPLAPPTLAVGKCLDAFLVPATLWDILSPTSYHVQTFPSAGDHVGVFMHTNITLPTVEPPDRSIPNIRHWGGRDLKKFSTHFARWMRQLPPDLPLHEKSSRVLSEIQRYVILHQKPLPREDPALLRLQSKLQAFPRDPEALKQWGAHIHQKRHRDVLRRLRRFRKSAATATGVFFRELCDWLTRPFERSVVSPDP